VKKRYEAEVSVKISGLPDQYVADRLITSIQELITSLYSESGDLVLGMFVNEYDPDEEGERYDQRR
jgi:hypothetical protein